MTRTLTNFMLIVFALVSTAAPAAGNAARSIVAVEAEIEADFGDMSEAMGLEDPIQTHVFRSSGVVFAPGHIAVASSALEVKQGAFGPMPVDFKRTTLYVIGADGVRHKAQVVQSIEGLGVSIVKIPNAAALEPISTTPSAAKTGDDLVGHGRMDSQHGHAPRASRGYIRSMVEKPAKLLILGGDFELGDGVFDAKGCFVGIAVTIAAEPSDLEAFGMFPSAGWLYCVPAAELTRASGQKDDAVASTPDSAKGEAGNPARDPEGDGAFESVDKDQDGTISLKDFVGYAETRLVGAPDEILESFAKTVDQDSNGKITRAEFTVRFEMLEKVPGIVVGDPEEMPGDSDGFDPEDGDDAPAKKKADKGDSAPDGWQTDLTSAKALAKKDDKPMLVVFSASWCPPCQALKKKVYPQASVKKALEAWVPVYVDADANEDLAKKHNIEGLPTLLILDASGKELSRQVGCNPTSTFFLKFLEDSKPE